MNSINDSFLMAHYLEFRLLLAVAVIVATAGSVALISWVATATKSIRASVDSGRDALSANGMAAAGSR